MYFDVIAKIVAERTGCEVSAVKPESTFTELGIDSLDTVELLMNLEDEIGIEIDLDQKVETIQDLDEFIQSKQVSDIPGRDGMDSRRQACGGRIRRRWSWHYRGRKCAW